MPKIDDGIHLVSVSNQALTYWLAGFKQTLLVFFFSFFNFFFLGGKEEDSFNKALRVGVQRAKTHFVALK